MELARNIAPRVGLPPLRFGLSRADVGQILGEPSHRAPEPELGMEHWVYPYLGLEVEFVSDAEWRCTSLSTESPSYLVGGRVVLGLTLRELRSIGTALGLGPGVPELDMSMEPGLAFPGSDLSIQFFDGIAGCVTWSAHIDAQDQWVWPTSARAA